MKKRVILGVGLLVIVLMTGCFSFDLFFPGADPPVDGRVSMLIVEAGKREGGATENLTNWNATGWAPWVEDERGEIVVFRTFDAESRLDSLYWAENLRAGTYTLKGFFHVYLDYSLLPAGITTLYEPFGGKPWHIMQRFALDEPVTILLKEAQMESFGRYFISSAWVEGITGTSDDRWRVNPASVTIEGDRFDKKALRVMKNWATATWLAWNTRNTEKAADR
jgi:hypothetical protein